TGNRTRGRRQRRRPGRRRGARSRGRVRAGQGTCAAGDDLRGAACIRRGAMTSSRMAQRLRREMADRISRKGKPNTITKARKDENTKKNRRQSAGQCRSSPVVFFRVFVLSRFRDSSSWRLCAFASRGLK